MRQALLVMAMLAVLVMVFIVVANFGWISP